MESLTGGMIPTVDLSSFTGDSNSSARRAAAKELARCCRPNGCVGIVGHGVPHELLVKAFEMSKKLFNLPMEDKMKAPHPKARVPHRGYSAPGREKALSREEILTNSDAANKAKRQIVDVHETYEVGDESNPIHGNIWLPDDVLPGFREFSTKLFWQLRDCAWMILEALMMSLDLPEEECKSLRKLHPEYGGQLRYAHYPPVSVEALNREEVGRLSEHTDFSSFTLLFQDNVGGLEFKNNVDGRFIPATPKGDMLYLNIGDWFMRITNGKYPSALHRVSAPQSAMANGELLTRERYSIPFFFSPNPDIVAGPLASCVTDENPAKYESMKVADYAARMLKFQYENNDILKK